MDILIERSRDVRNNATGYSCAIFVVAFQRVQNVLSEVFHIDSCLESLAEAAVSDQTILGNFFNALENEDDQLHYLLADFSANVFTDSDQNNLKKAQNHVLSIFVTVRIDPLVLSALLQHV